MAAMAQGMAAAEADEDRLRARLALAGAWGAGLTVAIIAASALLRLTAVPQGGEMVASLAPAVEQSARIAHRFAAMGVGLLAALALVMAARVRPVPTERAVAAIAIVVLTLLLAMIGRYTPGYRHAWVTVANVAAGTGLACAFWWLREQGVRSARPAPGIARTLAALALGLLFAQSALGAAASAYAMHGERAYGPLHLWVATLFVATAAAAAWHGRRRTGAAVAVISLAMFQFTMGLALVAAGAARPLALTLSHALVACALGLLLASLAARR